MNLAPKDQPPDLPLMSFIFRTHRPPPLRTGTVTPSETPGPGSLPLEAEAKLVTLEMEGGSPHLSPPSWPLSHPHCHLCDPPALRKSNLPRAFENLEKTPVPSWVSVSQTERIPQVEGPMGSLCGVEGPKTRTQRPTLG